jgi:hypothetical protein
MRAVVCAVMSLAFLLPQSGMAGWLSTALAGGQAECSRNCCRTKAKKSCCCRQKHAPVGSPAVMAGRTCPLDCAMPAVVLIGFAAMIAVHLISLGIAGAAGMATVASWLRSGDALLACALWARPPPQNTPVFDNAKF